MLIHQNFVGGNISVVSIDGDTVHLENQLRDTVGDWFYFAFCVEGAGGRTLTFSFDKDRLGYFGPAVSHDLVHWEWLGACQDFSFTYSFSEDENKVYFAHHMLYHPARFLSFANEKFIVKELCVSEKGRSVPFFTFGDGSVNIFLTARHHACESTGDYVLEGVLSELHEHPIENAKIFCIPFVDFDGVIDGDQGKSRAPHDHNRDYTQDTPSLYASVRAIRSLLDEYPPSFAFDFHSPWHKGGENDRVFIVRNRTDRLLRFDRFSALLEESMTPDAFPYRRGHDTPPNWKWNIPGPKCAYFMGEYPTSILTFTLETAYFGTKEHPVCPEKLIALGRCFAIALRKYLK